MVSRRGWLGAAALASWLVAGVLWSGGCGRPDEGGGAEAVTTAPLARSHEVPGPPPGEAPGNLRGPVRVLGDGAAWWVTWTDGSLARGARVGPDGRLLDPSPGVLLPGQGFHVDAAVPGTFLLADGAQVTMWPVDGPPETRPAPWAGEGSWAVAAAGGRDRFLVAFGPELWALSPSGRTLWHRTSDAPITPRLAGTSGGFLVGWEEDTPDGETRRVQVQPFADDGTPGEVVTVAGPGRLLLQDLTTGPSGVLARVMDFDDFRQHLVLLDAATGTPLGPTAVVPGFPRAVTRTPDGWLLDEDAQGWAVGADLTVTPAPLPFDPDWFFDEYDYDGTNGVLVQAMIEPDGPVKVGPVADGWPAYAVVSLGLARLRVVAVGASPAGWLVVEELWDDSRRHAVEAWRASFDGVLLDDAALRLGEAPTVLGSAPVAVAAAGEGWLVALGEEDGVRLVAVDAEGRTTERATACWAT